jgi:hypothetical protein
VASQGPEQGSPPGPDPRVPLAMSGQRRALLEALTERDRRLADMYAGSLHALGHTANPDRVAQAAHSIRELIEKLPAYIAIPVPERPPSLKPEVQRVIADWKKAKIETATIATVDPKSRKFLASWEKFVTWFEDNHASRRARTAATLRGLDPAGRALPGPIEGLRVAEWQEIDQFFVRAAHHGACSDEEYGGWLDAFERFLLDQLRPRTFEDFSALDAIIAEGERDA